MKAIQLSNISTGKLVLCDVDEPKGECIVKIHAAALNRRDQWMTVGKYPGTKAGVTLGSDGCGEVIKGPSEWLNKKVIINPNIDWGQSEDYQQKQYRILGMPEDGTLAEQIAVPIHRLHLQPDHLSETAAAALPLAGMTAYRACFTQGKLAPNMKVLVTGIGGGVALFALQYALAVGAEVFVTSSSDQKIQKARSLGAKAGFNYTSADWAKNAQIPGGYQLIVDGSGGDAMNEYIKLISPGGRIVVYGSTAGKPSSFDLYRVFWSQCSIIGSTMASDKEFNLMLDFVNKHKLKPVVDKVLSFAEYQDAFDRFLQPDHFGKIVLKW